MDASDWIALAAVLTTACIAVYSMYLSQTSAQKDRQAAANQASLAREQARLQETYVSLLAFAGEVGAWAQTILPILGGDPTAPEALHQPPPIKEQMAVEARLAALGSEEVRDCFEEWRGVLMQMRQRVTLTQMRASQKDPGAAGQEWGDFLTPWKELVDLRAVERAARAELETLIRRELRVLRED